MKTYYLGIDQSTQGTKALLLDRAGRVAFRADRSHRQIINERGWVEHDPEEIWANTLGVVRDVLAKAGADPSEVAGCGLSNQRETTAAFDRFTGKPVYNAIVWQCGRAAEIAERIAAGESFGIGHRPEEDGEAAGRAEGGELSNEELIFRTTGLKLSPYFSAAKMAWILQNVPEASEKQKNGSLVLGTMDSFLVHRLSGGKRTATDYSNASRTQLFNLRTLSWDSKVCGLFGILPESLPEVMDSDALYCMSDFEGIFPEPIPVHGVLGDSHAALFGQGCLKPGMTKATYGTGSSIMMNIGSGPVLSDEGVVTSLAWKIGGEVNYVLEGNINYTGAVVTWLKDDVGLIASAGETGQLAEESNPEDRCYLVPAFTGLGAPYWKSDARAAFVNMSRTTGRKELVRAGLDAIALQITDIVRAMNRSAAVPVSELRVDGGPTRNTWLMQRQSDLLSIPVLVPGAEELSGMGAAYAAGIASGFYTREVLFGASGAGKRTEYRPKMPDALRDELYSGWREAVARTF